MTEHIEDMASDELAGVELAAPPRVVKAAAGLAWLFIVAAATVWGDTGWALHRWAEAPGASASCWSVAAGHPLTQAAATYSATCLLPSNEGRRGG